MLRKRMSPARRSTPTPEARPCELPLTILRDRSVPVLRPHAGRPSGEVRERQQLGYLRLLRRAQHTSSRLLRALWRLRLAHASARTHIHIPWSCKIGPGFYIGHLGRVIINPAAVIGRNCNISTGVTIGMIPVGRRAGTPRIGDRVWIGTNAVIVGGIEIGDDVLIAPGAFVNVDVPSGATVIGNPGVVHPDHPCPSEYIQNPWEGTEP